MEINIENVYVTNYSENLLKDNDGDKDSEETCNSKDTHGLTRKEMLKLLSYLLHSSVPQYLIGSNELNEKQREFLHDYLWQSIEKIADSLDINMEDEYVEPCTLQIKEY